MRLISFMFNTLTWLGQGKTLSLSLVGVIIGSLGIVITIFAIWLSYRSKFERLKKEAETALEDEKRRCLHEVAALSMKFEVLSVAQNDGIRQIEKELVRLQNHAKATGASLWLEDPWMTSPIHLTAVAGTGDHKQEIEALKLSVEGESLVAKTWHKCKTIQLQSDGVLSIPLSDHTQNRSTPLAVIQLLRKGGFSQEEIPAIQVEAQCISHSAAFQAMNTLANRRGVIPRIGQSQFQRFIVTVDFTGFSRWMSTHGNPIASIYLTTALEDLARAVVNHGGDVISLTGDGFISSFPDSIIDTVKAVDSLFLGYRRSTIEWKTPLMLRVAISRGCIQRVSFGPAIQKLSWIGEAINTACHLNDLGLRHAHSLTCPWEEPDSGSAQGGYGRTPIKSAIDDYFTGGAGYERVSLGVQERVMVKNRQVGVSWPVTFPDEGEQ